MYNAPAPEVLPLSATAPDTLADVLHALGDVPPDRVLWNPRPGTATEADQLRYLNRDRRLVELIDGTLVEKPMGARESFLAVALSVHLFQFVRVGRLGVVGGADCLMRIVDGRNRLPDVCYTSWGRLPADDAHLQPVADFAPDLAVEVLSDSNTPAEIELKIRDYFRGGTLLVWVIDPDARTATVYTAPDAFTTLTAADTLDGGAVLPDFALSLADLFNEPQLNPRPAQA